MWSECFIIRNICWDPPIYNITFVGKGGQQKSDEGEGQVNITLNAEKTSGISINDIIFLEGGSQKVEKL